MRQDRKLLDRVEIATPCKADWATMKGDERTRFCGMCRLNVYNLSGMSRAEGEALIQKAEGRVCVRLWKREDGTVLTRDCPLGERIKRGVRRTAGFVAASFATLCGIVGVASWATRGVCQVQGGVPIDRVPMQGGIKMGEAVMGKVAAPPQKRDDRTDGAGR